MESLKSLERILLKAEGALLSALLAVMVALAFLQVVLRGVFSSGLLWGDTLLRHMVLWVGFLGAAVASGEDKHFAMDAAGRLLTGRAKAAAGALAQALTAAVCGLLAQAAWTFVRDERQAGAVLFSVGDLHLPAWPFELILPAGFALLALHALLKCVEAGARLAGRGEPR